MSKDLRRVLTRLFYIYPGNKAMGSTSQRSGPEELTQLLKIIDCLLGVFYERNTHHVSRLMYHFVWMPKYRHKVFAEPYREVLKAIIEKIGYNYDIDIVELEIPEDYVHMVVRGVPKMAPSGVMRIVKSISAREFFRLYPKVKRQYFWYSVSGAGYSGGHLAGLFYPIF